MIFTVGIWWPRKSYLS